MSEFSIEDVARIIGGDVIPGMQSAQVPGPGHSDKDRSLTVTLDSNAPDGFLVDSKSNDDWKACKDYVRRMLQLDVRASHTKPVKAKKTVAAGDPPSVEYIYNNVYGQPFLRVRRYYQSGKKVFAQSQWDGKKWVKGKPKAPKIPYRLDQLLTADEVFIVEGEKCADRLHEIGLVATTNSEGADNGKGTKWTKDLNEWFKDKVVYVLPDNDGPGRKHTQYVAASLKGIVKSVRIVELPGLQVDGDDVADWLDAGGDNTRDMLLQLCRAGAPPVQPPQDEPAPESAPQVSDIITEDSAALEFARVHAGKLLFDHDAGTWFRWSETHWQRDTTQVAFNWTRNLVRSMTAGEKDRVRFITSKASFAGAVERYAKADEALAVTQKVWDQDPFLLGTPDGTVDLRTGEIREASPTDRITKLTAAAPTEKADCPRWLKFLDEACQSDAELITFLQRLAGHCLTGDTREDIFAFIYGKGGNGKGTFLNTIAKVLGDYRTDTAIETLTASKMDRHPTELAALRGARLVTSTETDQGRYWNATRIKQLTGRDEVTARFMRQDFFSFQPEFKIIIMGNHQPHLRSVDDAMMRRLAIIPFNNKPSSVDRQLDAKLKTEWPGILRWMIDGCLDWQKNGLPRPTSVAAETHSYFTQQDTFMQWIDECCELSAKDQVLRGDLLMSFQAYSVDERIDKKDFYAACRSRLGLQDKTVMGKRYLVGIKLKPQAGTVQQHVGGHVGTQAGPQAEIPY